MSAWRATLRGVVRDYFEAARLTFRWKPPVFAAVWNKLVVASIAFSAFAMVITVRWVIGRGTAGSLGWAAAFALMAAGLGAYVVVDYRSVKREQGGSIESA